MYSAGNSYAELPLTIQWIGLSLIFLILGAVNRLLGVLGAGGVALSMLAAAGVRRIRADCRANTPGHWRVSIFGSSICSALRVRSLARERVKWRFEPAEAERGSQWSR